MVGDAGDGVGLKHVIDHQKIIIISLEYHPSLHHNTHTHAQDRIQTMYQVDWAERGGILLETLGMNFPVFVHLANNLSISSN